jgi:hypothetical protein
MTKFEDRLLGQLMAEHGHHLRAVQRPAPARRRAGRPLWLATGAVGTAAAVTATVMALGSAPALAAYSVTQRGGTVTVAVNRPSGVAGANTALHRMRARIAVVPVRPGCPPIGSLPRSHPAPHLSVSVAAGMPRKNGHRAIRVRIGKPGIPAGDTMILAFSSGPGRSSLGAGGIITGRVPRCVSLPSAPHGGAAQAQPAP